MPDIVRFNNEEKSWQVFTILEAFSDSMGAWRIMDVLGKPVVELPDELVTDLLQWKRLLRIVQQPKDDSKDGKNAT